MLVAPQVETFESATPSLQQRAAEGLFGDVRFRPDPRPMASLIESGLTEDVIVAAGETKGLQRPVMDMTLQDLDTSLPYLQDVCADGCGFGKQVISLSEEPKLARQQAQGSNYDRGYGTTFGLAVGIQLMPRYHGSYTDLEELGGYVVAIPANEQFTDDVDRDPFSSINASVVNPVAAAITQYRVVKRAMERSGRRALAQDSSRLPRQVAGIASIIS